MGLARMGQLIRFIPVTVVIGFTNGIAVVIFLAQIKDFFGLQIDNLPAEFFHRIKTLAAYAHTIDLPTLGLASACFVFLLSYNKLAQKIAILRRAPGRWPCWSSVRWSPSCSSCRSRPSAAASTAFPRNCPISGCPRCPSMTWAS
jgi:MFS superfamily sulfate permease-like transporter